MPKQLMPTAQTGVGIRIAHDPGDPLITSHCPFCGSGQVVGRSDGTISCDFCGQVYIVRVQPAFPGMPQMPNGPGAPSDIGPDGGVLPPDAVGPDGLPIGGEEDLPPGAEDDAEGFPPDAEEDDEGFPPEDDEGPPEGDDGDGDEGPPPPKKKDKGKSKKESVKTYRGPDGVVMTEDQYVRHLAIALSGNSAELLATMRKQAGPGIPILHYIEGDEPEELHNHLVSHHGFGGDEPTGYDPQGDPESEGPRLWDLHHNEHQVAGEYNRAGLDFPPGVMPVRHVHRSVHGVPLEASKA